jgi:hypothetical protein
MSNASDFVPTASVPRPINGTYLKPEKMADLVAATWRQGEHADTHARAASAQQVGGAARKAIPIATGVLDYFPDALKEVARVSVAGNDQHSPGEPLHWAKDKSKDHADALLRHMLDRGRVDDDGLRHSAKVAWRALALLQTEIERA